MNKNFNIVLAFIIGAIFGIALYSIYESDRKKRMESLKKRINQGSEADKENLRNDFQNIGSDFEKSVSRMKAQLNET